MNKYQWRVDYFENGKAKALCLFEDSLELVVRRWQQSTNGDLSRECIVRITNETRVMNLKCEQCIQHSHIGNILGQGFCEKHNLRFHMNRENIPCPQCAFEESLCHSCGKPIGDMDIFKQLRLPKTPSGEIPKPS
jgi:hypothetical protein